MNKKKKKIIVLLILLIVFMRVSYLFLRNEFTRKYTIKYNDYEIKIQEKYKYSHVDRNGYYIIKMNVDEAEYKIQILDKLNGKEKIIKKIYYYKNSDYKCIFPVFIDEKQYVDIVCTDNHEYIYYHDIINPSDSLKEFANSIKEYDIKNYNKIDSITNLDNVEFNSQYNQYGILTNYKGYYDIKNKAKIELFENDIYEQNIKAFVDKYYIVADYNQIYEFDKIFVIDITSGKKKEIICYPKISFDSYIQGVIDKHIYLYDKKNKKQYKINLENMTIQLVGNLEKGIKVYKNSEWEIETSSNCTNNIILFDNIYKSDLADTTYYKIDKVGIEIGNYYFYKKEENIYKVYKSTIDDKNKITYIFDTKTIDKVKYYDDKVYYIDDDVLKSYSDMTGITTILSFKEFRFNNSIDFGIYIK